MYQVSNSHEKTKKTRSFVSFICHYLLKLIWIKLSPKTPFHVMQIIRRLIYTNKCNQMWCTDFSSKTEPSQANVYKGKIVFHFLNLYLSYIFISILFSLHFVNFIHSPNKKFVETENKEKCSMFYAFKNRSCFYYEIFSDFHSFIPKWTQEQNDSIKMKNWVKIYGKRFWRWRIKKLRQIVDGMK